MKTISSLSLASQITLVWVMLMSLQSIIYYAVIDIFVIAPTVKNSLFLSIALIGLIGSLGFILTRWLIRPLQESEHYFRVAQDISLEAFTLLRSVRDTHNQIVDFEWTYANPAAGQILQIPPQALVGRRLLEVLPGNRENDSLFKRYVRIVETGQGDEVELPYHDDQITGWFRNMTVKLGDGVAVSFSDITKRKQTETILQNYQVELERLVAERTAELQATNLHLLQEIAERKQAEERLYKLSQAVEQSNSSIVITNLRGNIEFVNHAFTNITGYTFGEVRGQNPRVLKSGHQSPEFYEKLWGTLLREGTWQGELLNRKKNGTLYWELARIFTIKDSQGQPVNYAAVKDDITERKFLEIELQAANQRLMEAYDQTLEGWARALDLRDKETEGHSRRVTEMTLKLAQCLGVSESQCIHIRRGALLHDIGKMGIPDYILLKAGPLNEAEREIMQLHPVYAYQMLQPIAYLQPALDIPYNHHERWDGTGYPRGLKGEEIPLAARLFAIVDVWDALLSQRPYRAAWSKEKTCAYIAAQAGSHFDPQIVPIFISVCCGKYTPS